MRIHYYGHSCFAVELANKRLLFDPFIAGNPMAKDIDIQQVKADYILISHGHGDHVGDAEIIAKNNNAPLIGTYELMAWLESRGNFPVYHMNTGGKRKFDFGTVKMVNAIHSSMLPDGSYGANPTGFVVYGEEFSFYFAGDTALTMDMQLIPMIAPALDFAFLPIGDNFTMDYEDALIASDFIKCDTIIGCHYDTFPVIEIDHEKVSEAFRSKNKRIILPKVNEVFSI
jgi:L-ascorbate metabolism protein UlaG (beta-lactamase superfamily)